MEYFIDREVGKAILSIPISPSLPEDALIWAWTKKRGFHGKKCILGSSQVAGQRQRQRSRGGGVECEKKERVLDSYLGLKLPKQI